jgi:hypothetical protein
VCPPTELKSRDDIPLLLGGKKYFKLVLNGIYLPMRLPDWLLVEVALLLIGLTKTSLTKSGFNHTFVRESLLTTTFASLEKYCCGVRL